jgi:hypothetical protein
MPKRKRIPDAPISDELLLAAIERAECHRGASPDEPGEMLAQIKQHLGIPHHGGTTLMLRPKMQALQTAGLIDTFRRRDQEYWGPTDRGRQRLEALRRDDELGELPESPQHQYWREAQLAASQRIPGFRGDLRGTLDEAIRLLEADHETDSTTWYALSERLHQACRKLASATHCLREWPEPDDSHADKDDPPYRQRGRRHVHGWDSKYPF